MKQPFFLRSSGSGGFTLIEMLVTTGLAVMMMIFLLNGSLRNRLGLTEAARLAISDLRSAQANALFSKQYNGTSRCGYGVHLLSAQEATSARLLPNSSYYLYVSKTSSCGNNGYNPADADVITNRVVDPRLQVCSNTSNDGCNLASGSTPRFEDVFFQSPDGQMYVNNKSCRSAGQKYMSQIVIRKKNASCPSSNCIYICVYPTGRIESSANPCSTLINC